MAEPNSQGPSWGVFTDTPDGRTHVIPVDGEGANCCGHEFSPFCWCRPNIAEGGKVIEHSQPEWPGAGACTMH